jgi:taurine dioxygenase
MERQAEIADLFSPVIRSGDGLTYISNVRPDGQLGDNELAFHSDLAYAEYPYQGLSLHAVDVVDDATGTRFVSSMEAYQRLPGDLKQRIRDLHVQHVSSSKNMAGRPAKMVYESEHPQFVRPLVINHPDTGEPILYVTRGQTVRVLELSDQESDALLDELFGYLYAGDNTFEHRWRVGDIVLWDNYALQHARSSIKGHGNRTLQRTAAGQKSFYEQFPHLAGAYTNESTQAKAAS